jgi:hypothetical protein
LVWISERLFLGNGARQPDRVVMRVLKCFDLGGWLLRYRRLHFNQELSLFANRFEDSSDWQKAAIPM